jgi:hypothetical protein
MSGSGLGDPNYKNACNKFMQKSLGNNKLNLALDERGRIKNQYGTKLKQGTFGFHWVQKMIDKGNYEIIPWSNIDRGTKTQLKESHFDPEDYKYVETACATECKTIATHVKCYSKKVRKILRKRLKVEVKFPDECVNCYCTE